MLVGLAWCELTNCIRFRRNCRMVSITVLMVSWICLALVPAMLVIASSENDLRHCENIVINWAKSALVEEPTRDKLSLRDLLFFLHIPRTGGRTYYHCFLRKLYTGDQECPRSYDKLRFDPSKPKCRLVSTHDDYSMMSKLPKQHTSVVSILRNPIDRVFSTYEFSVEVAARFLVHPNLTSATKMSKRLRPKAQGVSTLDIWPWKYLVPWMREDLFARRDARKVKNMTGMDFPDSYNMEEVLMPLHIFINDTISHDIIHNGATFQIAGLTNNSYIYESHEIRRCVNRHPKLGQYVLHVAKKRLDDMLYVGLTEEHKESATIFANMVGSQVLSMMRTLNSSENSSISSSPSDSKPLKNSKKKQSLNESADNDGAVAAFESMTVSKLLESYEDCTTNLRKFQITRRTNSLKRIAPAKFSKEARLMVSQSVLDQILQLNGLDVELYKHAENLFVQQRKLLGPKLVKMEEIQRQLRLLQTTGIVLSQWKLFGFFTIASLFFVGLCHVRIKRRNLKLKI